MTILFLAGQNTGTSCVQYSQTAVARTLNFTSFNNGLQLNSPAVKPTDYEIQRFTLWQEYKLQVTQLKEIKQQLVEVSRSRLHH